MQTIQFDHQHQQQSVMQQQDNSMMIMESDRESRESDDGPEIAAQKEQSMFVWSTKYEVRSVLIKQHSGCSS